MNLEKEMEYHYINQFRGKIQKQVMADSDAPSFMIISKQKRLDSINSKIDSYDFPQNIKDKIQLISYQLHLEIIEDIKSSNYIFGNCCQCEYIKFNDANPEEEPYCLEEKKSCCEVLEEGPICLKMKEADPSEMEDNLHLVNEISEKCDNREIVIAKQMLEELKKEFTNKYLPNQNILRERI